MSIKHSAIISKASKELKSVEEFKWICKTKLPTYKQISLLRNALGMTQNQLAKRLGYNSYVPVAKLENENSNPTIETLEHYAEALGCELSVRFIPKQDLKKIVYERAEKKARGIVRLSTGNAAMELQQPNKEDIEVAIEELKNDLIKRKKRSLLWAD